MSSRRTPPAQWLKTFLSVAHHGSFSEAANYLHLTQAAVSKHIRQLEHSYGVSLFKRHARGVELSEAGLALRPKVEQAFELLAEAGDALQDDFRLRRVRLRCDATWAEAMLAPRLMTFCQQHPDIQLILNCYIWDDESSHTDADLMIVYGDGEIAGYDCQRLSTEHSFVVCSPELKSRIETEGPDLLAEVPRLVLTGHEHLWRRWDQSCGQSQHSPRLVCDSSIVCKRAACTGQGISMQRQSLVQQELASGALIRLDDINLDYSEAYYFHKQSGHQLNPAEKQVWDWVISLQN